VKRFFAAAAFILCAVITLNAAEESLRTLAVTGTAEISVEPDICYMSLVVETQSKKAVDAYTENSLIMNRVNAVVKTLNVDAKDMQTGYFAINPEYHWDDKSNKYIFDGYKVTHVLEVKIRKLENVSKVLDEAINAGATGVEGIHFTVENPKKYAEQAREDAIKAARKKAEQFARLTDVVLGKPLSISESEPGDYHYYAQTAMALDGAFRNGGATLEPGQVKLTHTVYITYEIH
jgi:uncharacterized protein YggE